MANELTPNSAPLATPLAGNATVTPPPQVGALTTPPEPLAGEGQNESISLDEARKLRSEAANLRKRMKGYEDAERLAQEAALSESQKSVKRADEAEARVKHMQSQLVNAHVKLAAQTKGIIDPDLAALAIQSSLEYDDEGMPSNLEKALTDLIKNKPYLVAQAQNAQQSAQPQKQTPQIPAMQPGRSSIQSPNSLTPGRIPTLHDVYKRP